MAFGQILSTDIVYDSGNALSPLIDIGQVCWCEYVTGRIVFASAVVIASCVRWLWWHECKAIFPVWVSMVARTR